MTYERIPQEMREFPQWVCWKYEQRGSKPTKVPVNPATGRLASVTNSADWVSFEDACEFAKRDGIDGIGFVFTDVDPFTGIDLDGDGETEKRIAVEFPTYQEISPSGRGLHIIVRGDVTSGRRRGTIEIYSRERYFTMTGNVHREAPITDCGPQLHELWGLLRPSSADVDASEHFAAASEEDAAIYERAANAANGEKFLRLWNGDGSDLSGDQSGSAIDQALVNMLAFYTKDPEQIERLWLASPQGQREKTLTRDDYRQSTINRAFDRELPKVEFDFLAMKKKQDEKAEAAQLAATMEAFPVILASDFAGKAPMPRPWHVPDMIPGRTVTLLSGDGGTGKSLLALQLAVATAAGRTWLGASVREGGCFFLTAEDDTEEVHRRLIDIGRSEGIEPEQLQRLAIWPLAGGDALLTATDGRNGALKPTARFAALKGEIEARRPALIVLDTLADLFGGEENNRAQVRQFVGMLRGLALEFDAAVLLLAHPSLTGMNNGSGLSGSTAWNNSVRSRLYLKKHEANANGRILETMKANYGTTGGQVVLEWKTGAFVASGHISADPQHKKLAENATDELFLQLLADFEAKGTALSPQYQSPTRYAPRLMAKHPQAGGTNEGGFKLAMVRLMAAGRIREASVRINRRETLTLCAVPK
ncbi:AAA family ATPase [Novosphingobium mangrovi (ex Hu et al. 2023)]|uniref:AAA family ATPase n=1 Tax=Novosphingobium mangrovi (ex Hu et al. 2023) TaxID=2930094 RepID=A0ABT0A9M4_9SPHN|nr:AAA family ATPase [Novosphingobium mangrovi (ex Hu et al. 2023)]MCJ1959893.1 AAA family ATPase [Novosphingobium mangrovi (ex Hu et al. 2023)]